MRKGCCPPTSTHSYSGNIIIWIVVVDKDITHVFIQRSGKPIEPHSIGCCCSMHAGKMENVLKYLDAALSCGQYDGLVFMGTEEVLNNLKCSLNDAVGSRIIAEIYRDMEDMSPDAILKIVQNCSMF